MFQVIKYEGRESRGKIPGAQGGGEKKPVIMKRGQEAAIKSGGGAI